MQSENYRIEELRAELGKRDGIVFSVDDSQQHALYLLAAAVVEVAQGLHSIASGMDNLRSDHPAFAESIAEPLQSIADAIESLGSVAVTLDGAIDTYVSGDPEHSASIFVKVVE